MKSPTRIVTLLAAGTVLSATAMLWAHSPRAVDEPEPSGHASLPQAHMTARELFTPQEQDGLILLLQSISTNSSMSANPSCPCGYQSHRNLSFNGHVRNPMADHAFRVTSVNIDAIEDAQGNSLLGRGNLSVNPQPNGHKPFVAAQHPGHNVYSYFNANIQVQGGMSLQPDRIAATVEVEIAKDVEIVELSRIAQQDSGELAPGMQFRLHTFDVADNGVLQVAFNYKIDDELESPPAFLRFEVLDPAGNDILRVDGINETRTRTSIVGTYTNSVSLGNREIGAIRVHVVDQVETIEFAFDQRGLTQLGL